MNESLKTLVEAFAFTGLMFIIAVVWYLLHALRRD